MPYDRRYSPRPYMWPVPCEVRVALDAPPERVRFLRSYRYERCTLESWSEAVAQCYCPPGPLVFIDSGAFSVEQGSEPIGVEAYGSYLLRQGGHAVAAANLDVIGDPRRTQKHQETLEAWGLNPLPVFHFGSPWRVLERAVERYPYVALGGLVGRRGPRCEVMGWLEGCFTRASRTGTVFHGFGVTSQTLLRAFPFYSCDSSTWCSAGRWGQVLLWDGECVQQVDVGRRHTPADLEPYRELLAAYHLTPEVMIQNSRHARRVLRRRLLGAAVLSMLRMARDLRRVHGPQSAAGVADPEGPGLHLYLAVSDLAGIWLALLQLALWQTPYTQCFDLEEGDALDPA